MIGLIPCGGTAERWGGFYKELLPIAEHSWMLNECIMRLHSYGCDKFVIPVRDDKLAILSQHLQRHLQLPIAFIPGCGNGMWPDLKRGMLFCGDETIIMSMPDTLLEIANIDDVIPYSRSAIKFGTFQTEDPGRYSVLTGSGFIKHPELPKKTYQAWGMVSWRPEITEWFLSNQFEQFDDAFNTISNKIGLYTYPITQYVDFANFEEYETYLCNRRLEAIT